jgi:ubiquinone/menaquinone biosynthesis C-methylase UbiE
MFKLERQFFVGKRILHVGCGPCGSLERTNDAARRVEVDPLARQYVDLDIAGSTGHRMEYIPGTVESLPFDDGSFDVVSSLNSIDHVDNLDDALAEIRRVLALSS